MRLPPHVGYVSRSQFTREYSRLFGTPPLRDVEQNRLPRVHQLLIGLHGEGQIAITGRNMPFILEKYRNRYYYADMSDLSLNSISELQVMLGEQLKALRLSKDLDQIATAEKAGISEKALRNLEAGRGSTVESFLRVLKALGSLDGLELLAPKPSVSPLALLRSSKTRQRVRQSSASRHRNP